MHVEHSNSRCKWFGEAFGLRPLRQGSQIVESLCFLPVLRASQAVAKLRHASQPKSCASCARRCVGQEEILCSIVTGKTILPFYSFSLLISLLIVRVFYVVWTAKLVLQLLTGDGDKGLADIGLGPIACVQSALTAGRQTTGKGYNYRGNLVLWAALLSLYHVFHISLFWKEVPHWAVHER